MTNPYFPTSYQPLYYPQQSNNYYNATAQQPTQFTGQQPTIQANQNNMNVPQQSNNNPYMIWVQGEVGEKSFNRPPNWPPNTPLPLWDSENPYVYLKSWDNAGKASITKINIKIEEEPAKGSTENNTTDFVKMEDFENLKDTSISRSEFNEFKQDMYNFLKANGFDDSEGKKKEDK